MARIGKRAGLVAAGMVVLILAVLLCVLLWRPSGVVVGNSPPQHTGAAQTDVSPNPVEPGVPSAAKQRNGHESDGIKEERGDSPRLGVKIICVDADDSPIEGLRLDLRGGQAFINNVPREVTTDLKGRAELRVDRLGPVFVKARSEEWLLEARINPDQLGDLVKLTAHRCATVYVRALLEDGQPFVGPCQATIRGLQRWDGGVRFDGSAFHELARVPIGNDIVFRFTEYMIGVDEQTIAIPAAQIAHLELITLRLKSNPSNQKGAIELDFSDYEGKASRQITITKPGSSITWAGGFAAPGVWRSKLLEPGQYVVRIEGGAGWESEIVSIVPREATRVLYRQHVPASVRVAVTDVNGDALAKAVLTTRTAIYINMETVRPRAGEVSFSDEAGIATLGGLRPGPRKLLIEASGYEPHIVEVDLAEGEDRLLPRVQLARAIGRIELALTGMKEDEPYALLLLQPSGGTVRVLKDVRSSELVLDALPLRRYVVAVIKGSGGPVTSKDVDLSTAHPTAAIVLDVAHLVEERMK